MVYFNTSFVAFSMDSRRCSSTGFAAPMTEVCGLRRGSQSSLKTKACIQYIWSIWCMVHYGPLHMAFMFSFIYTLTYSKSMCKNKYINIYWFGGPHKKNQKNLHIYLYILYTYIHIYIYKYVSDQNESYVQCLMHVLDRFGLWLWELLGD